MDHASIQYIFDMPGQRRRVGKAAAVCPGADKAQILLAKPGGGLQTQLHGQLRIVAQLGVGIQRQVVGEQVDVVGQQQRQALLHPAGDPAVPAAPEQAVVHKNRIGLRRNGRLDERAAGRDAGDDFANLRPPLDLQAIGAVVLEALGLQQRVKGLQQILSGGAYGVHGADCLS